MKLRYLLILLLLLPACTESGAMTTMMLSGGVSGTAAATDYTADGSMEGYWMMEQATGADATDGSGNGNTLTAFSDGSGPTRSADEQEGTYSSDFNSGNTEGFLLADASLSAGFPGKSDVSVPGSFSIGAWFALDVVDQACDGIHKYAGEDGSYRLRYNGEFYEFGISSNGTSINYLTIDDTAIVEDGTWYHVVGVYDDTANTVEIFVDGYPGTNAAADTTMSTGTDNFRLAKQDNAMDGRMDEVFVMSRALGDAEVLEIFTSGLAGGG